MFPKKINELANHLYDRTENSELKWDYSDENARVSIETDNMDVVLSYRFDEIEEVGSFTLVYTDNENHGKKYVFQTNQLDTSYSTAKRLYDSAQSSDLEINWDGLTNSKD